MTETVHLEEWNSVCSSEESEEAELSYDVEVSSDSYEFSAPGMILFCVNFLISSPTLNKTEMVLVSLLKNNQEVNNMFVYLDPDTENGAGAFELALQVKPGDKLTLFGTSSVDETTLEVQDCNHRYLK